MGYIAGGLVLLAILAMVFMFVMFFDFGITPKEVKGLYRVLRGRLSSLKAVIVVVGILILLFSLSIVIGILTGSIQIQF